MFWIFMIIASLGMTVFSLGKYSVLVAVLSLFLRVATAIIVVFSIFFLLKFIFRKYNAAD